MISMLLFYLLSAVDTLSQAYADKWKASEQLQESNAVLQMFTTGGLAYVVFGVILLVWLVLFTYLFRLDRKLTALEAHVQSSTKN